MEKNRPSVFHSSTLPLFHSSTRASEGKDFHQLGFCSDFSAVAYIPALRGKCPLQNRVSFWLYGFLSELTRRGVHVQ